MSHTTHRHIVYEHTFTISCSQCTPQFPDDHTRTVIADLFFDGTLPDTCMTSLSEGRSCVFRFEDTLKDVTYQLRMWAMEDTRIVCATYSIRIPYDGVPLFSVQQAIPPTTWSVHPNHDAFYWYARHLTLSSTIETSEVTVDTLCSTEDCVQLRAEDIVD